MDRQRKKESPVVLPLTIFGYVFFAVLVFTTEAFTYSDALHVLPLVLQIVFASFAILLFILRHRRPHFAPLILLAVFMISLLISMGLNGYDIHYNTTLTGIVCAVGAYLFFSSLGEQKKWGILVFYLSIIVFELYFIGYHAPDMISRLQAGKFEGLRLGKDFAPINMLSIIFVCGGGFSLYYLFFTPRKMWMGILYVLAYLLSFLCGFLLGSKQFIVSIVLATLLSIILVFGKKRWYFSVITIAALAGIIVLVFNLPAFATLNKRFASFFATGFRQDVTIVRPDYSTATRLSMVQDALYLFTKKPLFGYGLWGFAQNSAYDTYSHNTITNGLAEMGLFGFIPYILLLIWPILNLIGKKIRKSDYLVFILVLIYLAQTLFGVIYWHKFTFFLIGLSIAISESSKPEIDAELQVFPVK